MGDVIKAYQLDKADTSNMLKPFIYCKPPQELEENAVSINIALAREFKKQSSPMMRTMRLEANLLSVIESLGEDPVIKDFDVLFNPEYQTDIIKALINTYRKKHFRVIWPGRYEDGKLYYAEEGYRDYIFYNIADYDVTVII